MRMLTTIALLLAFIGCDGSQRGKFVVGSSGSVRLEPSFAQLTCIRGTSNPSDGSAESLLLAVVVVAPGFESTGSKDQYSSATYVTSSKSTYEGPTGKLETSYKWNRETDLVTINKKEFKRGDGNVFLMKFASPQNKESQCVQVPGTIDCQTASEILEEVRKNSSKDQVALQIVEGLRDPK